MSRPRDPSEIRGDLPRRAFLEDGLKLFGAYALVQALGTRRLLASPMAAELDRWAERIRQRSADLRIRELTPRQWQDEIEGLLEQISLEELLRYIDFEALEKTLRYPDLGVDTARVVLPGFGPKPRGLSFHPKLFGMEEGRAIIPHGHRHMASAHLVLGGGFHLRQYDRVREEEKAWWVEPTVDTQIGPGHASSISDERNNVHWLVATGGRAYTLDIIVTGLSESGPDYEIQNLDPEGAEPTSEGWLRMPKLALDQALKRYGKDHHA